MAKTMERKAETVRQRSGKPGTSVGVEPPVLYKKIGIEEAKKLGQDLSNFASQNNLLVEIAGKKYMQVEGWQFVGTQLGLTDVVKSCFRITEPEQLLDKELKYRAEVEIINQHGTVISRGIAYASNQESKKKSFEEYAVASMAQTRAIGKAYRNFLAWIIKMAGYEATPYEEVDKDKMETDLSKAKRNVLKAFNEAGYDDSTEMIKIIEVATGKPTIDTIDDVNKVLGYLESLSEESE